MWNDNKIVAEVKHLAEMGGVFLIHGKFSVNYHIGILYLSIGWFIMKIYEWRWSMTTSDMIRELCEKKNISLAELCRRIGQTPQNFNKKLKRGTVSFEEMLEIAEALGVGYEQAFILPDGNEIKAGSK